MEYNIYDLQEYDSKNYPYHEEARKYSRLRSFYTIFSIFLFLLAAAFAIYCSLESGPLSYIILFLLCFFFWDICLQNLLFYQIVKKINKRMDQQIAHDYNYYFYVHNPIKKKSVFLIALSANQCKRNQFTMSQYALDLIDKEHLNKQQLRQYYLLNIITSKGLGLEEAYESYRNAYNMMNSSDDMLSAEVTVEEMIGMLGIKEQQKKEISWLKKLFAVFSYLIVSIFYFLLEASLPNGIEYRQWFSYTGYSIIWLTGIGILFWLILKFYKYVRGLYRSELRKNLLFILCILVTILTLFATFFGYLTKIVSIEEEQENGNGTVIVKDYGNHSLIYEKKGIFLRKYIRSQLEEKQITVPNTTTEKENSTNYILQDQTALREAYELIYDATGNELEYELLYSAKGVLYLSTKSQKEGDGTVCFRLVYDRESENGGCSEFVYYKDYYDANGNSSLGTEILNFYAFVHESKEVIPANKTTWGSGGDEEYRKATGE